MKERKEVWRASVTQRMNEEKGRMVEQGNKDGVEERKEN